AGIADAVADRLAEIDPDHAADYAANAERLRADLTELDQEFDSGLKSCERSEFITNHAAFGYLARKYGLTQIAISGLTPDTEPSPARIAAIHSEAREHKITTIFYETLVSPAVAEAVAGDLGLKTDVLDPIEGITPDSRGKDYLEVMRANLTALRTANGCQ
ncbi:MAG TPA: metal ABC transporter substrate-binding protein, partial [Microlunatus sp.]|nr:metal ABC transporter substrate-binding protein [Microlunatus sp.]